MILDKENQFCDGQAITASGMSTDVIDLGAANQDIGEGEPMGVLITIDVAADDTTGDETYNFKLQQDDNSGFSSGADVAGVSLDVARGTAAGNKYVLPVPKYAITEQYLGVYATLGGTTPTVTFSAFLLPLSHIQNWNAKSDFE